MKKKIFLLTLLTFSAIQAKNSSITDQAQMVEQGCNYLISKKICLPKDDKCDYRFDLDILAIQARQSGLEYGIKTHSNTLFGTFLQSYDGFYLHPNFDWEPAVRAAFSVLTTYDNWNVTASSSYFSTRSSSSSFLSADSTSIDGSGIMPVGAGADPYSQMFGSQTSARWSRANVDYKLKLNDADLYVYRNSWMSEKVSIDNGFGLKAAWIRQNYDIRYYDPSLVEYIGTFQTATVYKADALLANNSFSIGPMYLFDSKWRLSKQWKISVAGRCALLSTRFHSIRKDYSVSLPIGTLTSLQVNVDSVYWTFRPMTQLMMGIGWDYCVACSKRQKPYQLGINLSYEFQSYWKQNEWIQNAGGHGGYFTGQTNLHLHGVALNLNSTF